MSTIHKLVEAQVERTPDAPAVRFQGQTLSYAELNERANKVAHHLKGLGAGPEVRIAICLERSIEMVVGVLGILKAGAAYVPLDPAWPADRLAFMLEDAAAPILLTQSAVADEMPAVYVPILCLDADWPTIDGEPGTDAEGGADGESLAYVIYTSGSTGKPKGVLVAHKNLVHSTQARFAYYDQPVTSFLLLSSFSFDSSMAGIFWTLCQGGTITLPAEGMIEDPSRLAGLVREAQVSHLLCVPSLYTFLLGSASPADLASLRAVIVAGEAVPIDTVHAHHARYPAIELHNEYGPTEATVWCTVHKTREGEPGPRVSIGKAIAGTQVYVLDARRRRVPIGVSGEVYVGGAGVARGYLNRPELTDEKFVPSPFSKDPGARLYRTGDLAKLRPDGTIDFLGRIDHQVKIRGYRIELGEIEAILGQQRSVAEAVVIAREDTPGELRLVGYVVAAEGAEPQSADLKAALGAVLPAYMVPTAIVVLDAMPLLPNGKVDRKGFPAPEARAGLADAMAAPRNPVEDVLAGIWASVLGAERVGVHDNFFDLGGHSLLATQVIAKIVETFGVELPLALLFETPTVAALASAIDTQSRLGQGITLAPIERLPRDRGLPLSFGQERLWVLDQIEPDNHFYNLPGAVRLSGTLDVEALGAALDALARRHEILRTSFGADAGTPVLVFHDDVPLRPTFVDLSHVEAQEDAVRREARDEAQRPFRLSAAPLVRSRLLRLDETEHVLLFTMHHIIADGWSMAILVREVSELYQSLSTGAPSRLRELPIQYADYASWQRDFLRGEVLERQLAYWTDALRGAPTVLDLATDRPRPAIMTYRGSRRALTFSRELSRAVTELCRRQGVTLYMLALAAFGALIHRYSGQDDVLIGTSVSDRPRTETEGLIGYFLSQLVFRVKMDGDPTFKELLTRVREMALGAYAHKDLPFERLVEQMRLAPDMSRTPLFQVMVDVPNAPSQPIDLQGLTMKGFEPEMGTARFDLTLSLSEGPNGLAGSLEYSTDLFEEATIGRMLRHFEALLESASSDPSVTLSALAMLGADEREQLVVTWNQTDAPFPADRCIHDLIQEQADRTPDAVAVALGDETLSYRELCSRANQLAHHLVGLGVGPDVLVGLCMSRTPALVVGMLGILKAGGAYVPIDPAYPLERQAFLLEDSMAPIVVTEQRLVDALPSLGAMLVQIDADWADIAAQPTTSPDAGATSDHLAYVIYTSGSTGQPKGAMIRHRGLVNYVTWAVAAYGAASGSGAAVHSSMSFDLTVTGLYCPLLAGKTVFLIPEEDEIGALAAMLAGRKGLSLVKLTPAHLTVLAHTMPAGAAAGAAGALVIGGEALTWANVAFFRENAPGTSLINEYGPTETVVGCCVYDAAKGPVGEHDVPIGRPIANTRLYVLGRHMEVLPVGGTGELFIGGEGVARGYWSRPELTEERFVPDPFGGEGARLYRTGDRARYRADGNLEFLGRIDGQVKLRGYRIELGEIEAALRRYGPIGDAVVIVREDTPGDRRLVAYAVLAAGHDELGDALGHLAAKLPGYMVPSAVVTLAEMPLTAHGKVNRAALPAPGEAPQRAFVAPRTPVEEVLTGIWEDVLGRGGIGAFDNFFELGGHSLLAARILARVRSAFDVELPFRALFDGPTAAELGARIEQALSGKRGALSTTVVPVPRDGRPLALSFAQERLWFLAQLDGGSAVYNVPEVLRLVGPLDAAALEWALQQVALRHEVLRTAVDTVDGAAVVRVHPDARIALPVTDLAALDDGARAAAVTAAAAIEANAPFDLARGPLLRASLLRLGAEEHVLLVTLHHIVSDAWSIGILIREVTALYEARRSGAPSPLPALPIQYADFAHWQRSHLVGDVLEAELSYWKTQLAGLSALELPIDMRRPATQSSRGASLAFELPPRLAAGLEQVSREQGATLFMTLLAAFSLLLGRYAGQDDIAVGTPIANRGLGETEGLVGLFLNALVLRSDLGGDPTFVELLARVKETALAAYAHQQVPFERVVDAVQPARDMSRTPLFQVLFTLQDRAEPLTMPSGLRVSQEPSADVHARFDLALGLGRSGDGLTGVFEYCADLFMPGTIAAMAASWTGLLEAIVASPGRRAHELFVLPEAARTQMLVEWNATEVAYRSDARVDRLITEQASAHPDRVAVAFRDQALTYGELEARSNQLARHLQRLGVGRDVLVGLCVTRSLDMVIGILGIMKAGGAYVPLDPAYPEARLAFILQDASAPVLVTQQSVLDELTALASPREARQVVRLDADAPAIAAEENGPVVTPSGPDDLAYAIYTSGSTGVPKGVEIPHKALTNFVASIARSPGLTPGSRLLAVTSLSFDIAGLELFVPLSVGATVDVVPGDMTGDGDWLRDRLAATPVTIMQATPATWRLLLDCGWAGKPGLVILCGGEAFPRSLADELHDKGAAVWNMFGPTETTIWSSQHRVMPGEGPVPIGRPLANTQMYILDAHMRPLPPGAAGELYIGGDGLARGYHARPALTLERFVPSPFVEGARLYRTGDLARFLPGGDIAFIGRLDHQVKIRGHRIELGEIEAALAKHDRVREAVVVAREDVPGQKRLVAYLTTPQDEPAPTVGALRAALQASLPDYMLPQAFVLLERMPLTPNGKIDRKALPAPDVGRAGLGAEHVAPRSAVEGLLAEAFAAVLRLERVSVMDNFFELGGDSILSIQIVSRARQLGLAITPRQMFQHQTVAALATVAAQTAVVRAEQGPVTGPLPLLPGQMALAAAPEASLALARLLRLTGTLDAGAMERAVTRLLAHHDGLRLRVVGGDAPTAHLVEAGGAAPFSISDGDVDASLARATALLDLATGPVIQVVAITPAGLPASVLVVAHAMAVDDRSMELVCEDLLTAYAAERSAVASPLAPKTTSLKAWAEHLAERASATAYDGGEALAAPAWPRSSTGASEPGEVAASLGVDATQRLLGEALSAYKTDASELVLTALVEALAQRPGASRVLVSVEHAGRDAEGDLDVSRTVGRLAWSVPVAFDLEGGKGPGAHIKAVKEQARRAASAAVARGGARGAEAPVGFRYLPVDEGLRRVGRAPATSPLTISAQVEQGALTLRFAYAVGLDRAVVEALAGATMAALGALVEHCLSPEGGGYTPSDFELVEVSQATLDMLSMLDEDEEGEQA